MGGAVKKEIDYVKLLGLFEEGILKQEMIDGEVYLLAPASDEHRLTQKNFSDIFNRYFRQNDRKCVAVFEKQLWINERNYYEPDLVVYCRDNNEKKGRRVPVIIIEVLSKSTQKKDTTVKLKKYAELGIEEYWTVDCKYRTVTIYKLNGDSGEYDLHESYAHLLDEDFSDIPEIRELQQADAILEFSPLSFPEMTVKLEEVFDFEALEYM